MKTEAMNENEKKGMLKAGRPAGGRATAAALPLFVRRQVQGETKQCAVRWAPRLAALHEAGEGAAENTPEVGIKWQSANRTRNALSAVDAP